MEFTKHWKSFDKIKCFGEEFLMFLQLRKSSKQYHCENQNNDLSHQKKQLFFKHDVDNVHVLRISKKKYNENKHMNTSTAALENSFLQNST